MKEPIWLNAADIYGIHKEIIAVAGGKAGILNAGAIASSLSKAKNVFHYSDNIDLFTLAAVSGYGFTKNHCFLEGNTQVGLIAVYTFLAINGFELIASEENVTQMFSEVAASQTSQATEIEKLAQWLRDNTKSNQFLE
ncbi:death-on-curing family protein [[Leptolyngbya] sp. PCC 7376]|uniref:type II toxin-antitoxin system death-on-curing family toxin n=1 Tax=[Leptolyngbya] sp. PCC 7376 TaxID=111781 RepID=UPI00029F2BAE|nr:type II toxin-antitoxin system death-on-curing family toxin [[Leptolyngbya] sp. PCC 7376]AFY38157.1 death-on-curing family protein [[Leptolyngbya] sp. PCC 7376]